MRYCIVQFNKPSQVEYQSRVAANDERLSFEMHRKKYPVLLGFHRTRIYAIRRGRQRYMYAGHVMS